MPLLSRIGPGQSMLSISTPSFLLGGRGEGVQSQILKRGDQKKMSAWGDLKTPCHGYLPGGAYYVSYQKKTFKNKIWLCV